MMFIGSRSCASATAQTDGGSSPRDLVRAVARPALGRLRLTQAALAVRLQRGHDGGRVLREPSLGLRRVTGAMLARLRRYCHSLDVGHDAQASQEPRA